MRSEAPARGPAEPSDLTFAPLLKAVGVIKRFSSKAAALTNASIEVSRGEVVALLGPSGSGKTTFLLCLAGVTGTDGGEITYAGLSLSSMSDSELARLRRTHFGFVFQFGQLLPELTALENVGLPLRLNGVGREKADSVALEQLAALGIGDLASQRQASMSGGEAQRVAVARALVTHPEIVFADEPTGALDSKNSIVVMQLLVEAARSQNAAVILVTHDSGIASYSDREVHIMDGATVGTP